MSASRNRALAGGLLVGGLGFLGAALASSPPAAVDAQSPTPELEQQEYALGSINLGLLTADAPRTGRFEGRNATDQAWTVKRVWPDCGCVTVLDFPERVAPGERFEIQFSIDPRSLTRARVEKKVQMLIDPPGEILVGRLEAEVLANPHFEPQGVIRRVEEGRSAWTHEVALRAPITGSQPRAELVSVPAGFTAEMGDWREAEGQLELPILLSGSLELDCAELVRALRVELSDWTLDGAAAVEIDLPIYLLRRPALLASPSALDLVVGPDGTLPEAIRVSIDGEFDLLATSVEPAEFESLLAPRVVDGQLHLATAGLEPGDRAEVILTRQDGARLAVPVRVMDHASSN